jgi:hypothetical protein
LEERSSENQLGDDNKINVVDPKNWTIF